MDCTLENTFAKTLPKVNADKALRISQVKGQRQPNEYVPVVSLFLFYKGLIKVRFFPHKIKRGYFIMDIGQIITGLMFVATAYFALNLAYELFSSKKEEEKKAA